MTSPTTRAPGAGADARRRQHRQCARQRRDHPGPAPGHLRQRAARRALHHRRRPWQREHRADRRAQRVPLRAQPAAADDHRRHRSSDGLMPRLTAAEATAWQTTDPASGWTYGERLFQAATLRAPRCSTSTWCSKSSRARWSPSINPFIGDGINFVERPQPGDRRRVRAPDLSPRPLDADRDDRPRRRRTEPTYDIPLLDAFLNPLEFNRRSWRNRSTAAARPPAPSSRVARVSSATRSTSS